MVVATTAAVAVVATGGTAALAGAGIGMTAGGTAATTGTAAAVGTAVGASTAGGAIAGTAAAGTATGAALGAAAGGTAAAGVGSSGLGAGLLAGGIGAGPIGWLCVGTSQSYDGNQITYDCWKPVVHDMSMEPSNGMLLKDLVCHPHVASASVTPTCNENLPQIVLENIWNEKFEIEYLQFLDTGKIVCHAKPQSPS